MQRFDRAELASLLRRARARVQPADVGLNAGRRRQTPGLRRQEVAQLAGMSVDYYIRLEQGRGPRPSRAILVAIGRALRLSGSELAYLHELAGSTPPPPTGPAREVRPGLLHLLDRLDDTPAMVCDAVYTVLAWNAMAAALIGDFSILAPDERNVMARFFTDPAVRGRYDEATAEAFAREAVGSLRSARARYPDDPGVARLFDRLHASSEEFRTLWTEGDVRTGRSTRKRLRHPLVGWLDLDCEALHDPDRDQWVIFYTAPLGTSSHEALRLLKVIGTQTLTTETHH
jgi:transcriptional regulator with XRE-family HTH domain